MTEAIEVYPKRIENHMKTIHNSFEYDLQAKDKEKTSEGAPIITRYDELGEPHIIKADKVVRTIWKGAREGAKREMQREGYTKEVVEIDNTYK